MMRGERNMSKQNSSIIILIIMVIFLFSGVQADAVRIKDMITIKNIRSNQLIGYGLVVGLSGTGDKSGARFTYQAMANMMDRLGIDVDASQISVKNVAAVMVTASLPPFARIGTKIDVVVSSIGDAKSLVGGTLLVTPLRGIDGKTYAICQGPLVIGGFGAGGQGGGKTKNHVHVGRIARGATVEREILVKLNGKDHLTISLNDADFTTVKRVSQAIDQAVGEGATSLLDSKTLRLNIPEQWRANVPMLIADIESIEVEPDMVARIVVNEKTGTVVIGENVKISTVAVSHGNLSIEIRESQEVSQPNPLSQGQTVSTPETSIEIQEEKKHLIVVPRNMTIGELVRGLNAIGVSPRDMITIFQSIKAAGALQAELVIL
jgi:flagellar P-ring protein FlgI